MSLWGYRFVATYIQGTLDELMGPGVYIGCTLQGGGGGGEEAPLGWGVEN